MTQQTDRRQAPGPVFEIEASEGWATGVLFLADGSVLTTGVDDLVKHWNPTSAVLVREFQGHAKSVDALAVDRRGSRLLSGSVDATARLWDLDSGTCLHVLAGHKKTVAAVTWIDEDLVATASYDTTVRLWNTADGIEVATLAGHRKNVVALAVSPDGALLASGGVADEVRLWSLPDGEPADSFHAHDLAVSGLHFMADGRLLTLGADDYLRLWNVTDGKLVGESDLPAERVMSLAVSPDEEFAAITANGRALLVDLDTFGVAATIPFDVKGVYGAAFSADGRTLAIAASDRMVRGWSVSELVAQ
jgi:WD40 repeat protein